MRVPASLILLFLACSPQHRSSHRRSPGASRASSSLLTGLTYSFAHYRLAKLYAKLGQRDRAEEHWLTFVDTFTNPDPEYEWMVGEVSAELDKLLQGR